MKKRIVLIMTLIMFTCFSTVAAHAGSARRHTIEGFLLGTGAVILGTAIIHELNRNAKPSRNWHDQTWGKPGRHYIPRHYNRGCKQIKHHRHGHWKIQQIWIEPVYEEKWNPGHYNPRGKWICGRYEHFLMQKGYYQEKRVWIRY